LKSKNIPIYSKQFAYEFLIDIEQMSKDKNKKLIDLYTTRMNYYKKLAGFPFGNKN